MLLLINVDAIKLLDIKLIVPSDELNLQYKDNSPLL